MSGLRRIVRRVLAAAAVLVMVLVAGAGLVSVSISRLFETFSTTGAAAVCAGAFITGGRDVARIDAETFSKEPPRDRIYRWLTFTVDRERRRATAHAWPNRDVHAVYVEGRGCVLVPPGSDPDSIAAAASDRGSRPGARHETMVVVTRISAGDQDEARLDKAVAAMFAETRHRTHSVLVYRHGELVREAYAQGAGPRVASESWSLGKTIIGTLAGALISDGTLSLDETVDLPQWPHGDPRRAIRIRDLLGMSGGLAFTTEFETWPLFLQSDHGKVYYNLPDVVAFVADRPLARRPGSEGSYNNADPILLLAHIRHKLKLDAAGLRRLVWERVLEPVGMQDTVLSTDFAGMPIMTGYVYAPARDWGRLGLLYLRNGFLADGRRLFDDAYATFAATPAAGYPQGAYGGLLWLNRYGYYSVPRQALVMSGAGDQVVIVDRENGIVIVRMGHSAKSRDAFRTIDAALREIFASFGVEAPEGWGKK